MTPPWSSATSTPTTPNEANVRATLDKLEGRSEFKGTPNELVVPSQAKL